MTEFEKFIASDEYKKIDALINNWQWNDVVKKIFEAGQRHPEWIPVTEKPWYGHQTFVSVKLDNDIVRPALFHPEPSYVMFTYEGHTISGVVAWQPLPKE
jgi:hypothetical protein